VPFDPPLLPAMMYCIIYIYSSVEQKRERERNSFVLACGKQRFKIFLWLGCRFRARELAGKSWGNESEENASQFNMTSQVVLRLIAQNCLRNVGCLSSHKKNLFLFVVLFLHVRPLRLALLHTVLVSIVTDLVPQAVPIRQYIYHEDYRVCM
jgi:hypothetical protein